MVKMSVYVCDIHAANSSPPTQISLLTCILLQTTLNVI